MLNIQHIRGRDIAQELADNCFTDEQKEVLEFTQGKVKITIADQIIRLYGCNLLTNNKEDTIKFFAYKVNEYSYLIDDLRQKIDLIRLIKDPKNRAQKSEAQITTVAVSQGENKHSSAAVSNNDNKTSTTVENVTEARTFQAEPVELIDLKEA